ncbi:MAG: transposase [Deltaproteobacteria bacterium]|nr:transposase [Deltaproteobacteria bacterium]
MLPTAAWLLTFRTYATWLPGDARGWNRHSTSSGPSEREHPQAHLARHAEDHLTSSPVTLTPQERAVVERAIRDVCSHRLWHLLALAVRSNHVHAVVATAEAPPKVAGAWKAWSTRRLREDTGGSWPAVWARGLSQRHLPREADVATAIAYVLEGQDGPRE